MKKIWIILMLSGMLLVTGCSFQKAIDSLPFGGVQGEVSGEREEPLQKQERLSLQHFSGDIQLVPSEDSTLRVQYTQRITFQGSREELDRTLGELPLTVDKDGYSVNISPPSVEKETKIKGQQVDMTIQVPKQLKYIKIKGTSGTIGVSGLKQQEAITLSLDSGSIRMEQCSTKDFSIEVLSGNADLEQIQGNGNVKLSAGNADFKKIQGDMTYQSTSGKLTMEEFEGALNGELSSGTMDIRKARLETSSSLYATSGTILLQVEKINADGQYSIEASSANIRLKLPQDQGYDMDIQSATGKVEGSMDFDGPSVEKTSDRLKGRVGAGGADIRIFITSGNVRVE